MARSKRCSVVSCGGVVHGEKRCIEHHLAGCPQLKLWTGGATAECTCGSAIPKVPKRKTRAK